MRDQAIDGVDATSTRAAMLREAFDRAFAELPGGEVQESQDFLAVRLAGDPFAIRLADTAGLFADRKVTPVPTTVAEFRGIAGFRGALVPVYDLAVLVGYPPSTSGRWLLLSADAKAAVCFDAFEGHFRVASDAIAMRASAGPSRYVHQIARRGDLVWPVIGLADAVAAIRRQYPNSNARKE